MEHDHQGSSVGNRRFRIWVHGRLDERFSEGLAGIEQEDVSAGTMLSGALLDQSQFHSTLDLLRSLGIDVLRFEVDPPLAPSGTGLAEHVGDPNEATRHLHPHESTLRPSEWDGGHDKGERVDERSDRLRQQDRDNQGGS